MRLAVPILVASLASALATPPCRADPTTDVRIPTLGEQFLRQWRIENTAPIAESPDFVRSRDETESRLSLRDAIATALANNPGIAVERLGPAFARADVARSNGIFDPVVEASARVEHSTQPTSSVLSGASVLRERKNVFGLSIRKLIKTGATLTIEGDSTETNSNSSFLGLRPQYEPSLTFTIAQPLLKNFGLDLTVLLVRSAEATSSAAYFKFQASAVNLVRDVIGAYWGLVQARETLQAERDGLRLAQTLVTENQARVRAGALAPLAVKEAQAEAASRDERVIAAENAVAVASDRLRLLVQQNPEGAFVPRPIEPTDGPEVRDLTPDENESLQGAIATRPEIQQLRYDLESRKILSKVKRNNLLPGLDLNARYGLNGLSGRSIPQTDFNGNPVVTPFTGDYGRALDRLGSDDFNSYSAGLTLSVPLGNTTAEAEYTQSEIDVRRGELALRQRLADVTLEVRKAIGDVKTNSKRITATRLARELAAETLDQQKKRYDVGLATTKDLLDYQQRLTSARSAEIQALIDYNVALASLKSSSGTLLGDYGVVLDTLPPSPTPLWARF